jgi:hypothetical protein
MRELFPAGQINSSLVKLFNYPSSIIALNKGKGKFVIQKLPPMAQISSTNALLQMDVNNDGYLDLVLGGNNFGFPPQFGRLDASYGDVLINDHKGGFSRLDYLQSGLEVKGEVRDIKEISSPGKTFVLFLVNDQFPVMYESKETKKKLLN